MNGSSISRTQRIGIVALNVLGSMAVSGIFVYAGIGRLMTNPPEYLSAALWLSMAGALAFLSFRAK